MSMLDALLQAGAAQSLARDVGTDERTAQAGLQALLPAVLGGMQNQAGAQPQGLGGLASMFGQMGGGGLFDQAIGAQPTPVQPGNQLLGSLFGSKDTSRAVADHASQQSGVSPDLLKKMLPIVAMLAAGYFAKQAGGQGAAIGAGAGGLGGLGSLLGGAMGGGAGGANPLGAILGGLMGARR